MASAWLCRLCSCLAYLHGQIMLSRPHKWTSALIFGLRSVWEGCSCRIYTDRKTSEGDCPHPLCLDILPSKQGSSCTVVCEDDLRS